MSIRSLDMGGARTTSVRLADSLDNPEINHTVGHGPFGCAFLINPIRMAKLTLRNNPKGKVEIMRSAPEAAFGATLEEMLLAR